MTREYHKWFSNRLQREMELLVFGHGGRAVLFFPTRMARFYDYENWGIVHALNTRIEMKYPWLFKKSVGISGRYDLTKAPGDFKDLLDGYHNEAVYLNMSEQYIPNLNDNYLLNAIRNIEVILAVGETDPFLSGNRVFSSILWNKGISNQFHIWGSNAHRPHYWRQMVPIYL